MNHARRLTKVFASYFPGICTIVYLPQKRDYAHLVNLALIYIYFFLLLFIHNFSLMYFLVCFTETLLFIYTETYEEARQKLPEAEINTDLTDVDSPPVRRKRHM